MAASKLFEQLQKAAAARAAMSPSPDPAPQPSVAESDAMAERERAEIEVREAPIDANPRFPLARGFAVIAVLLALVLGWFYVPWRTPVADTAKPPPTLKIDPKLDLGRK